MAKLRSLVIVLGDQVDLDAPSTDSTRNGIRSGWPRSPRSWHVWSSEQLTALFLSAIRHFALSVQGAGRDLVYSRLEPSNNAGSLGAQLHADFLRLRPARLIITDPDYWRLLQAIKTVAAARSIPLDVRVDSHFFTSVRGFAAHAKSRKVLRMDYSYRGQCKRYQVLMEVTACLTSRSVDGGTLTALIAGPLAIRDQASCRRASVLNPMI